MFITNDRSGYRGTSQYGSGMFLMVFCNANAPRRSINGRNRMDIRCLVRKVALRQCGQFMMGRATLMGHRFSLSGTYGSDGLPIEITEHKRLNEPTKPPAPDTYASLEDLKASRAKHEAYYEALFKCKWGDVEKVPGLWERLHPLPDDLVEAFWEGGGHNSAGSEGSSLYAWARENLIKLRHFVPKEK